MINKNLLTEICDTMQKNNNSSSPGNGLGGLPREQEKGKQEWAGEREEKGGAETQKGEALDSRRDLHNRSRFSERTEAKGT